MLIFCTEYFQIWLPVVSTFMVCVSNYFSPGCVSKVSNATKKHKCEFILHYVVESYYLVVVSVEWGNIII